MNSSNPPRWDLSNIYPGLQSPELAMAFSELAAKIQAFKLSLSSAPGPNAAAADLAAAAAVLITELNQISELNSTLERYLYSFISTDSLNENAMRKYSEVEQIGVAVNQQTLRFTAWIGKIADRLDEIIPLNAVLSAHAFYLRDCAYQSCHLMASEQEDLAAELKISGAQAWSKLQGTITSQLSADLEVDGQVRSLPLPAIINLHSHPDETVRRQAYEKEIDLLASAQVPLAAALNGVKGAVNTVERRRGRENALQSALDTARIDQTTLDALLDAMKDSFPMFRRYFRAKARRIGKNRLAWWDLFAPVSTAERTFTYSEAVSFILEQFLNFSPGLSNFARKAFDRGWIDAEQRKGKRGGAFCMDLPLPKESRILSNFDGTLDQVFTLAHELGHAFHNECLYAAGKTFLQSIIPMTLAETASILCETILFEAALSSAGSPQEELSILETALIGDTQLIVDIYSRFLFEREVFRRRREAELSAQELCEIMLNAQRVTYADGLDDRYLNPYMWAWKPHYYYPDLNFYNFPYTFGQLFGIGLYSIYRQRGPAFITDYQALLASTGEASAADLASRFGIDIRDRGFWDSSLAVIARRIERYLML